MKKNKKRTRPTGMENKKTVHLPKDLHAAVAAVAKKEGRTVGKQIEVVLRDWLA